MVETDLSYPGLGSPAQLSITRVWGEPGNEARPGYEARLWWLLLYAVAITHIYFLMKALETHQV